MKYLILLLSGVAIGVEWTMVFVPRTEVTGVVTYSAMIIALILGAVFGYLLWKEVQDERR